MNLMFRVVQDVARIRGPEYDIEILEAHHRLKKDSPERTAVRLGEVVAGATAAISARSGFTEERDWVRADPRRDRMQVIRAGKSSSTPSSSRDRRTVESFTRAHSRDNFARGAVRAAPLRGRPAQRPLRHAGLIRIREGV